MSKWQIDGSKEAISRAHSCSRIPSGSNRLTVSPAPIAETITGTLISSPSLVRTPTALSSSNKIAVTGVAARALPPASSITGTSPEAMALAPPTG
jgi:hypothetical protein